MIVDSLANASRYHALHPRLAAAFDYLASFDPATPDGKYPIDADRVHVLVQSYATKPAAEKKWESHRRYLDVQYIVSGRELITVAPIGALAGATEYNEAKDVINYSGASGEASTLFVEGGQFAIFLPEDGHRPGVAVDATEDVRKVVVKVALVAP
jgi:YhcH/YjgK/YiaL family protein